MDQKRFSKYKLNKGLSAELKASEIYHQRAIPLLVDPYLLKSFNLGQIDIAYITKSRINIIEVKNQYDPHKSQYMRINKTKKWLGDLFKRPAVLDVHLSLNKNNARQEEKRFLP